MWIFLPWGFFSVVEHRGDPDLLCVRARSRRDLETLIGALSLGRIVPKLTIVRTPKADYPLRIIVERIVLADFMARFINNEITYDNFKAAASAAGCGPVRNHAHHEVWEAMRTAEDPKARR